MKKIKTLFHFKTKIECPFWPTNCAQSVYRKYNSFFDLKRKVFRKFFILHLLISWPKLKNERIFRNSFFDFKSKNKFENFDFCYSKLVWNQNRVKKIIFSFFLLQCINQIRKMKDIFWICAVRVYFVHSISNCIFWLKIEFYPNFQFNLISYSLIRFWILKHKSIMEIQHLNFQFLKAKIFFIKSSFQ